MILLLIIGFGTFFIYGAYKCEDLKKQEKITQHENKLKDKEFKKMLQAEQQRAEQKNITMCKEINTEIRHLEKMRMELLKLRQKSNDANDIIFYDNEIKKINSQLINLKDYKELF